MARQCLGHGSQCRWVREWSRPSTHPAPNPFFWGVSAEAQGGEHRALLPPPQPVSTQGERKKWKSEKCPMPSNPSDTSCWHSSSKAMLCQASLVQLSTRQELKLLQSNKIPKSQSSRWAGEHPGERNPKSSPISYQHQDLSPDCRLNHHKLSCLAPKWSTGYQNFWNPVWRCQTQQGLLGLRGIRRLLPKSSWASQAAYCNDATQTKEMVCFIDYLSKPMTLAMHRNKAG